MNIFFRLSSLLALLSAALVATAQVATAPESPQAPGYLLQAGDVLQVSVWKETDLTAEVVVRPDGRISFPLAGDLQAAGDTVDHLRSTLETRLRRLVPEAAVSVGLKMPQGNRIYVIGKVNKPGDFMLNRPTDVMQALALAGGATPFADVNDIKVLRRVDGRAVAVSFRYSEVERGRNLEQNIALEGGDTVVVP